MTDDSILTVISSPRCGACNILKDQLDSIGTKYTIIDIEEAKEIYPIGYLEKGLPLTFYDDVFLFEGTMDSRFDKEDMSGFIFHQIQRAKMLRLEYENKKN